MTRYILDNAWHQARERLALLEAQYDPGSIRYLEALGVGPGWRCLEVGPGGGSITTWLCERVGPTGYVLAVDLDPRFVAALSYPQLEVRRLDILADDLPAGAFDLAFARLVLEHLPRPEEALGRMIEATRPGGWVLVEDQDIISLVPTPSVDAALADRFTRCWAAMAQVSVAGGMDVHYGRRLYGALGAQGLVEVGAEGRVGMLRGGTPFGRRARLNIEQLRPRLVGAGLATDDEVDAFATLHDDPALVWMGQIMMAAWGRRPPA
jgi:SAM-dependent methyltransferase